MLQSLKVWSGKRLALGAVVVGTVLLGAVGSRLRAQSAFGGGAPTADEAAKRFVAFLALPGPWQQGNDDLKRTLVAQKSLDLLERQGVDRLLMEFFKEYQTARWGATSALGEKEDSAVVQVTPSNDIKPIVCVREGNGWRVDLVATFARWNDLDETQSLKRISEITGQAIPGVPLSEAASLSLCQGNLKSLSLGMAQYVQDYDEKYPPANKWCDVIAPYIKNEGLYHCPVTGRKNYGYAMNWKFSRRDLAELQEPAETVGLYESSVLKRNQNGDGRDLTFRHQPGSELGANYAFADGHVHWFSRSQPQNFRLSNALIKPPAIRPH